MRASIEVADIFRAAGPSYRTARAGRLSLDQLKVMSAIEHCRTAVMGGHVDACTDCGHWRVTANRLSGWANVAIADARGREITSNQFYFTPAQLADAAARSIHTSGEQTVTASGGASYRFDALRLSGDMLYGSGLRRTLPTGTPNGDHLPGYVQINLSAVYRIAQFRQHPLDVRLDLINVLDRQYELRDGSALGDGQPQWGARRGIFVGVEQAF